MKGFFADGIIRCLLYDDFLRPQIPHACLQFVTHTYGFFVRLYMRVCKKMVIYLGVKRKYTWEKTARISCHNFETNGRPYCNGCEHAAVSLGIRSLVLYFSVASKDIQGFVTNDFRTMNRR